MWSMSLGAAEVSVLAFHLAELGLLLGGKNLEKRCLGFGVVRNHLGRQVADVVGSLLDGSRVIGFDCRFQVLMSGFQAVLDVRLGRDHIVEDGRRLLLLGGGQVQVLRHHGKVMLHVRRWTAGWWSHLLRKCRRGHKRQDDCD